MTALQTALLFLLKEVLAEFAAFLKAFFEQRANDPRFITFTMDSIHLIQATHADWPWTEKLKAVVEGWEENGSHYKGSLDYAKEIGLDIERAVAVTAASTLHKQVADEIANGIRDLTNVALTSLTERIMPAVAAGA